MRTADRGEFEQVFRSGYPSVLRTAYLVLHDRGRAEEVTQDGFLPAVPARGRRRSTYDHPVAWVRKVVVRDDDPAGRARATPAARARARRPRANDRLPDLDLLQALAELPSRQRAAVVLFYLEDRPVDEIADLMDVSASTVKQHLYQARKRLSQVLVGGVVGDVG